MPPLTGHVVPGESGGIEIPLALAEIAAGWPLAASLAAVAAGGLRAGRRRTALNEALHELRRPLQALALSAPAGRRAEPAVEWSLQMASAALERLEREINGEPVASPVATLRARPLLEAAVGRWRSRAALAGGSLELRWRAADPRLRGDGYALAQALDNLVVNAIEHGGPQIVVEAGSTGGRLRIAVRDSGRASRPASRRETPVELIARLSGHRRRGHGLRVVRRTAADHGGEFTLRRSDSGTTAMLELPLLEIGGAV
jgi:signal transduction histidine kinase